MPSNSRGKRLVERIKRHRKEKQEIARELVNAGKARVKELCRTRSLRQVGRETGLSPTYLSMVRSGLVPISQGAYLLLWNVTQTKGDE